MRLAATLALIASLAYPSPVHAGSKAKRIAALEEKVAALEQLLRGGPVTRGSSPATDLSAIVPAGTDILYVVQDPAGTPVSTKSTVASLATPLAADFLRLDASNDPVTARLEINPGAALSSLALQNTGSGGAASDGLELSIENASSDAFLWQYENAALALGTNNQQRVTLTSSGDVGVGTNSPAAALEVEVAGAGDSDVLIDGDTGLAKLTLDGAVGVFSANASSALDLLTIEDDASNTPLGIEGGGDGNLWLDSAGDVGVGTSSPDTQLHVAGEAKITDTNTGGLAGTHLCIDANNRVCVCGSCA